METDKKEFGSRWTVRRDLEEAKGRASGGGGKGLGKGGGKGQAHLGARGRTVYFGKFPENTFAQDIIEFMKSKSDGFIDKVGKDGIYLHGQPIATSGAVRFRSDGAMSDYLMAHKGKLNHLFKDDTTKIFISTDALATG